MNPQKFQILAEQNRLNIVELLRTGAKPVNDIAARLQLHQPQVSKHLKILADAGMVKVYPVAQKRYYQLQPKPFRQLDTWLGRYKNIWEERFDRLDRLLAKEVKKHGRAK